RKIFTLKSMNNKTFLFISRGGAVWQLVGLITQRSEVQILPPQPIKIKEVRKFSWLECQPVTLEVAGSSPVRIAILRSHTCHWTCIFGSTIYGVGGKNPLAPFFSIKIENK